MSRHFTTGNSITCAAGDGADLASDAFAYGVIWRATGGTPSAMGLIQAINAGASNVWSCNPFSDGNVYFSVNGFTQGPTYVGASPWYLMLACVPLDDGSGVTPRFHVYDFTAETWSHTDGSGTLHNASNGPVLSTLIGTAFGSSLEGDQALVGEFGPAIVALSDGAIEALGLESALYNWVAAPGIAVLQPLNQASTSDPVVDITGGGADQTAIAGTSISGSDPPGFDFSPTPPAAAAGIWGVHI